MKEELAQQLYDKYPSLYRDNETNKVICGIACDDGWYLLIDVLSDLLVSRSVELKADQVKQKFGSLRFYIDDYEKKDISYILISYHLLINFAKILMIFVIY